MALPTAGAFLREAAGRYVALDGRLARTLFHLSFQPGFLTREYFAGRRRRYIRPARLFLVLALALFAVLRIVHETHPGAMIVIDDAQPESTQRPGSGAPGKTAVKADAAAEGGRIEPEGSPAAADSSSIELFAPGVPWGLKFDEELHGTVIGPEGRVRDRLQARLDRINRLDRQQRAEQVQAGVLRYGPYAQIALLPCFALLLQIVYAGRATRYPQRPSRYAEHLVFGAHNHAFACLALIVATVSPWPLLAALVVLWMVCYFFWSLKVVYGGRWSGVFVRGMVISVAQLALFGLFTIVLLLAALVLQ